VDALEQIQALLEDGQEAALALEEVLGRRAAGGPHDAAFLDEELVQVRAQTAVLAENRLYLFAFHGDLLGEARAAGGHSASAGSEPAASSEDRPPTRGVQASIWPSPGASGGSPRG